MKLAAFLSVLVLTTAALVGCAETPAEPPIPSPSPMSSTMPTEMPHDVGWACPFPASEAWGGAGIGDPYSPLWGNGGYDAQHYDISLEVDIEDNRVMGQTVIRAETDQALDAFNLDAWVSTACPRIAIDDHATFSKPVITPVELDVVLGARKWEEYAFDEI